MLNFMVDILSIKWIAKCKKIPDTYVSELSKCNRNILLEDC